MSDERIYSFSAIVDDNSRVLILGTAPSVMSMREGMFYGHPQNKFWRILALILDCECPKTNDKKRQFLLKNRIAVWDTLHSCVRPGSSLDSFIREEIPNDIPALINRYKKIRHIFLNGGSAYKYYKKYSEKRISIGYTKLPSTSPANASISMENKIESWSKIKEFL